MVFKPDRRGYNLVVTSGLRCFAKGNRGINIPDLEEDGRHERMAYLEAMKPPSILWHHRDAGSRYDLTHGRGAVFHYERKQRYRLARTVRTAPPPLYRDHGLQRIQIWCI